jgi:hypothetical protein
MDLNEIKKALAQMSERAGREYGGNDVLVLGWSPKALRNGRAG